MDNILEFGFNNISMHDIEVVNGGGVNELDGGSDGSDHTDHQYSLCASAELWSESGVPVAVGIGIFVGFVCAVTGEDIYW